jgi:hypothetical protein
VISGSDDRSVRLWELSSRSGTGSENAPTCLAVLWGHTARVWGVAAAGFDAMRNQNTHIVSVGEDSTARLWEINLTPGSVPEGAPQGTSFGAQEACQLEGRSGNSLWRVAAGPAGVPIATAADDGSIRLWRPSLDRGLHVAEASGEGEGKGDSVSGMSAEQWHVLPDASADSPYFSRLRNAPVNRLEFVRAMVMLDRHCVLGDGRPLPPPTAADGTICAATNRGYRSARSVVTRAPSDYVGPGWARCGARTSRLLVVAAMLLRCDYHECTRRT